MLSMELEVRDASYARSGSVVCRWEDKVGDRGSYGLGWDEALRDQCLLFRYDTERVY